MNEPRDRLHRRWAKRGRRQAGRPGWLRPRRAGPVVALLAPLVLLLAACGSGPNKPGVASGSATAATAPASGAADTQAGGLLAYARCMRSHGVANFPDPDGSGQIPKTLVIPAARSVSSAQFRAAGDACSHLLAGNGLSGQPTQHITAQDQQDYLRGAACMRSHGIANFPDPVFSDGNVSFPIPSGIDTHSARFTRAEQICRKLIPAGLPYSE